MAQTARALMTLLEEAQSGKVEAINAALQIIDAAAALLTASQTFTGANIFSSTVGIGGVFGGNPTGAGTALQKKSATVTPASDADHTLTAVEMSCPLLTVVAGSWTTGRSIIVPAAAGGEWHFSNSTGFAMLVKTAAGSGITIANARAATLRSNGTNVRRETPDVDPTI